MQTWRFKAGQTLLWEDIKEVEENEKMVTSSCCSYSLSTIAWTLVKSEKWFWNVIHFCLLCFAALLNEGGRRARVMFNRHQSNHFLRHKLSISLQSIKLIFKYHDNFVVLTKDCHIYKLCQKRMKRKLSQWKMMLFVLQSLQRVFSGFYYPIPNPIFISIYQYVKLLVGWASFFILVLNIAKGTTDPRIEFILSK